MINKLVFQEKQYSVWVIKKPPLPVEWIVSDSIHSFSVGKQPKLELESLKQEMMDYLEERNNGVLDFDYKDLD